MEIKIAGRSVPIGARLYHMGWDTFGTVTGYDPSGSAELSIVSSTGARRRMFVTEGGYINGVKQVYWHDKIELYLPIEDVSTLQKVVDLFSGELMKLKGECNG